ncbi:MAG: adenylate/guanylate cyclase domain-containing protein [Elsteraceae bacterium]
MTANPILEPIAPTKGAEVPAWAFFLNNWMLTAGRRITEPAPFVNAFGVQLRVSGSPIQRLFLVVRTLNQNFSSWSIEWSERSPASYRALFGTARDTVQFVGSPAAEVRATRQPKRRRLIDLQARTDHRVLFELQALGCTDYFAAPLPFSGDAMNFVSFATEAPNGFTSEDLAGLAAIIPTLGAVMESIERRHLESSLLSTYVGAQSAREILAGRVRRGDADCQMAAIWYSDLRDFTGLSERLEREALVELLNSYFEVVESAVAARGGECLQFIGDAILAVFRGPEDSDPRPLCRDAWDAAADMIANLPVTNGRRRRARQPAIRLGLGLHVGHITHCNVGSPTRLAFNVIGPPVNFTARLQALCKSVSVPLLMSEEFAALIDEPTRLVGTFDFKGVSEARAVYAPTDANIDALS